MQVTKSSFKRFSRFGTVEPRFNEVAGDRPNLFVKSRVRYIENLNITNLRGNNQNVSEKRERNGHECGMVCCAHYRWT